ncbi:prolyl-tRNA synthetase associated domain-containing protein [Youngiibacter fragilis]|uniref:Prolyl-tRNA synthetase n=1 Tax=Youngiibacter fragilis 232.1 TaxID=994573 RepID=V7I959_9CLOT|nr:prolyl-tRNA synthetase associated domain-containing protein [Youngiibacter fragilis]ETA81809.1 prolyl-tRNA synthetase [Youngiibacter fragilis 232.1]
MYRIEEVIGLLDSRGIEYEIERHVPVYTIEEMDALKLPFSDLVVKNLFLRDYKGREHFLVVLRKDKNADLKKLKGIIGSTPLSFASEDRLSKYLGLSKGEVTPFGVLNDESHSVRVYIDKDVVSDGKLAIHPNDNRATVLIGILDLIGLIEGYGTEVRTIDLEGDCNG